MRRFAWVMVLILLLAACGGTTRELPTLAPTLVPSPQALMYGETVDVSLVEGEGPLRYRFTGDAGDVVLVEVSGGEARLLDGTRTAAGEIASGRRIQQTLGVGGVYVVEVRGAGEVSLSLARQTPVPVLPTETATPAVTATPTPRPVADLGSLISTITSADPAFGAFNTAEERHVYTFQGAAGSFVRLRMENTSGTVDPLLTLYGPDGRALAVDDNAGGGLVALIDGARLPEDGVYAVQAWGGGFAGTYALTLETAPQAFPVTPVFDGSGQIASAPTPTQAVVLTPTVQAVDGGSNQLQDHVPVAESIERAGAFDRFVLPVEASQSYALGLRALGDDLTVDLQLFSPSGSVVETVSEPGRDGEWLIPGFIAESGDPYSVIVTGRESGTGDYVLSYGQGTTRADVRQAETFADRSYQATVRRRAVRHVWYARLEQGDIISASATTDAVSFNPVLEVVAPDGRVLITDDNSGEGSNAQIQSVRAQEAGLYQLRVRAASAEQLGAYTLVWRYIEAAPTPLPPLIVDEILVVADAVRENEVQTYPLQAFAGERVLIEVNAVLGTGLDPVVTLLNPNDEVLAEADDQERPDGTADLNPRLLTQIPADGIYTVQVAGYLSGGNYVLRVKRVF